MLNFFKFIPLFYNKIFFRIGYELFIWNNSSHIFYVERRSSAGPASFAGSVETFCYVKISFIVEKFFRITTFYELKDFYFSFSRSSVFCFSVYFIHYNLELIFDVMNFNRET